MQGQHKPGLDNANTCCFVGWTSLRLVKVIHDWLPGLACFFSTNVIGPSFCFGELNYHQRSSFFSTELATTLPPLLHVAAAQLPLP